MMRHMVTLYVDKLEFYRNERLTALKVEEKPEEANAEAEAEAEGEEAASPTRIVVEQE